MITNLLYVIVMIHVSKRAREDPGADFFSFQTPSSSFKSLQIERCTSCLHSLAYASKS